jgi:hypothetical protein
MVAPRPSEYAPNVHARRAVSSGSRRP